MMQWANGVDMLGKGAWYDHDRFGGREIDNGYCQHLLSSTLFPRLGLGRFHADADVYSWSQVLAEPPQNRLHIRARPIFHTPCPSLGLLYCLAEIDLIWGYYCCALVPGRVRQQICDATQRN